MGPRTGLDNVERRKIFPLSGLELRPLGSPAHIDCAILAPSINPKCYKRKIERERKEEWDVQETKQTL
jgi:hypothetical protein